MMYVLVIRCKIVTIRIVLVRKSEFINPAKLSLIWC